LYSSVNNHDESKSILSLYEIIAIIIVFSFMLYLLFPKKNIDNFLETQAGHANLSIQYLESMILYHPNNEKLKFILMEKYTQSGEERKALQLNQELMQSSNNQKLLQELRQSEYLLEKNLYFKNQTKGRLQQLKKKLLTLYEADKENTDHLFFFRESSNIDYSYLKYESLINHLKQNPNKVDYKLEKMAYDLATKLNYKEKALEHLQSLVKYPNIDDELSEYLIYSLFEKEKYAKAKAITTQLFSTSQTDNELTKHFHLALYALVQDKARNSIEISQLIQEYANLKVLLDADISIILNTLLELGETKEAANFVINVFYSIPENFDETGIDLALQSLLYNGELDHAQLLTFYALGKFDTQKYLNKSIEVSTWLSDDETVRELNVEGYQRYKGEPYLSYFLSQENLNKNHEILVQIYEDKIKQKEYSFIHKMGEYYHHTGEIEKASNYFQNLYQKSWQEPALYYAVEFSHHNSDFETSVTLYHQYRETYGSDTKLHELTTQSLMALKRFDEAHKLHLASQKEHKNKNYLTDLAWLEKDYAYLYKTFWELEKHKKLTAQQFEQLILLEKMFNEGKRVSYLYQQSWEKHQNLYHLTDLLYTLLQNKEFKKFQELIDTINSSNNKHLKNHVYYQSLVADFYVQTDNVHLALQTYQHLLRLNPENTNLHQNYLWLLIDNQHKFSFLNESIEQHLNHLQARPKLRESLGLVPLIAAMSQKKYILASSWITQLILKYPKQKEYVHLRKELQKIEKEKLYVEYYKMLDPDYLDTHINFNEKHYGSQLTTKTTTLSHQWRLYQKIKSKIIFNHYHHKSQQHTHQQNSLEFTLRNSENDFLWNLHLGTIQTKKDFVTASLDLGYKLNNFNVKLKGEYHNKTELTPRLAQHSLENALTMDFTTHINQKTSLNLHAKKREFIETRTSQVLGKAKHLQLSANYVLRSGYPDISFNSYLGYHQFSKTIAKDFSEIGFSSSVGRIRQYTLNHSWKPFGTLSFAFNDEQNIGASATLGVSKVVNHRNSFDLLFEYYNGIGVISEPIYELNLRYRF
jgi:hypothetical protein